MLLKVDAAIARKQPGVKNNDQHVLFGDFHHCSPLIAGRVLRG